jgi:anaerobic magnesium-protoporphyrin IX monomethyl ester cyclase
MHIALIHPKISDGAVSITPPLGLAYLAAVLEKKGVRVTCLAADAEQLSCDQAAKRILELDVDVVGISTTTLSVNNAKRIWKRIKSDMSNVIGIAGGPHATVFPEELLGAGFDFVVRGEGESTISEIVDLLNGKTKIQEVRGLSYIEAGKMCHNDNRPLISDLDSLPYPAWHYFPLDLYHSEFKKSDLCLPIITSRGCPGHCVFCYKGLFGNRFRVRSPGKIVEEISFFIHRYGIEEFAVVDDSFTSIPIRVTRFCELLLEKKIVIPWSLPSGVRVDTASEQLFSALKSAGCYRIGFGVESGNDDILKSIKKNTTKEQARNAVEMAKNAMLEVYCFFMLGNLEETIDTLNDTIRFAIELNPDVAQFSIATPLPGSEMFNMLESNNRLISYNWEDYNYLKSRVNVFRHKHLSSSLLAKKLRQAYLAFYLRPGYIIGRIRQLKKSEDFLKNVQAFLRLFSILKK